MIMTRFFLTVNLALLFFISSGCTKTEEALTISITNSLSIDRFSETVSINISDLKIDNSDNNGLKLVEQISGKVILSQLADNNGDGIADVLLFQPEVKANSVAKYSVIETSDTSHIESKLYSRFVPERIDDYAWENDRVAFRTYGPTAQKMKVEGVEDGIISSGMDCWLKKVDYPIINKWYKKHTTGVGSYHIDTGEGLDDFHVGTSRGCGGLGVYLNENLYVSKNFTDYTTLLNGPIRTEFTLDYADWKAADIVVSEKKKISLDLGSNLMHVAAKIEGTETVTIGLTLNKNDGDILVDTINNCFSYWQAHADSELGTAIVVHAKYYKGFTKVTSEEDDKSHLLIHLKVIDGVAAYYTGFNWKASKQFKNQQEWELYLHDFARKLDVPLTFVID